MNKEPAVGIGGGISAILFAVVAILKAGGMDVTEEMTNGIDALIYALCAIPAVGGLITRFFVYSPASADKIRLDAYAAGTPPTQPPPPLPDPPGGA